ncbi:MAG: SCO family protein [Hyphomicrobiaceae bacterium]|nr:SCO family protein [Hyphomicrobiaceae bacterium]
MGFMLGRRRVLASLNAAIAGLALLAMSSLYAPALAHSDAQRPRGVVLAPLFQLTTHEGRRLTRADIRGKPFVVVFGFTDCPSICPTALLDMTNLLADLGPDGDRIKVLFVSVDPERDTPDQLRKYLASFDPRIVGLTGQTVDIAAVAHAFDATYEKVFDKGGGYTVDHTTKVFLMDRYGLLAAAVEPGTSNRRRSGLIRRLLLQ